MKEERIESERDASAEFAERFRSVETALRRYMAAHVPGHHQAEDAFQETAMALWRSYRQYDPDRPFQAWAFGIARNQALKSRRDAGRDRLVFQEDVASTLCDRLETRADELDGRRRFLDGCMEKIPEQHRGLLHMKYRDRKRIEAIASLVGKTPNAVRLLLYRIRDAVRQCMEEAWRQVRDREEALA